MQKKLTVLVVFATFVLVMVWAVTPAQAHTKFCGSQPTHKHCSEPAPDDGDGSGKLDMKMTIDDNSGLKFFGIDGKDVRNLFLKW